MGINLDIHSFSFPFSSVFSGPSQDPLLFIVNHVVCFVDMTLFSGQCVCDSWVSLKALLFFANLLLKQFSNFPLSIAWEPFVFRMFKKEMCFSGKSHGKMFFHQRKSILGKQAMIDTCICWLLQWKKCFDNRNIAKATK